jgi:hypothetical protein
MVMGAGGGTIDADLPDHLAHRIRSGLHMGEQPVPGAVASPAIESISARLPRPVALGQIPPRRSRAQLP